MYLVESGRVKVLLASPEGGEKIICICQTGDIFGELTLIGTWRGVVTTLMNQFRERGLVDYKPRSIWVFPERVNAYLDQSHI